MRKFFILILFCSFLSCSSNDNLPKNTIVYGEKEITIKTAAKTTWEELIGTDADEEKPIFETHLFAFMNKSELVSSSESNNIVYIAITENLFDKKIDMRNPEPLENGSEILLATFINEKKSVIYILAPDEDGTRRRHGVIETGNFQLDYKNGKCTLTIDAGLRDGTLFSCRYEGEIVTTGVESIFQQFLEP